MPNLILLFRESLDQEHELYTAQKYWVVTTSRMCIKPNSLVIGRYSVLPYYLELEKDLQNIGSKLINSYQQHKWIADIENWYNELSEFTFPTYFSNWDLLPEGSYVLKGRTNSRKTKWQTHMFAATKKDVPIIFEKLLTDTLIGDQGIVVRKYIPLKKFGTAINGLPISNEYRLFYLGENIIAGGFYWSIYDGNDKPQQVPDQAIIFANKIAKIASQFTIFYVLDIAETASGEWILVEINDGQMSGLSDINHDEFYKNLFKLIQL